MKSDLFPVPFPFGKGCLPSREDLRLSKVNALRELQSVSGEDLSPPFHFGDASQSALLPSMLRPQGGAFKGEL